MNRRRVFQDPALEKTFLAEGWVLLRGAISDERIQELRDFHQHSAHSDERGFFSSLWSSDADYKRSVFQQLEATGTDIAAMHFKDYRVLVANFVTKISGAPTEVSPHADWTLVDETTASSVSIWFPLNDAPTMNDGTLLVVPKSHQLVRSIRGFGIPGPIDGIDPIPLDRMTPLPTKAGDVIVYDHRLLHASASLSDGNRRIAIGIGLVPEETQPVVFHHSEDEPEGLARQYAINREFFVEHTYGPVLPSSATALSTISDPVELLLAADLEPLLRPGVELEDSSAPSEPDHESQSDLQELAKPAIDARHSVARRLLGRARRKLRR